MASRKLEDLHPVTREKTEKFLKRAKENGIEVLIYCTYRSPEEQEILYMQDRLEQFGITLNELNERRKKLGLWELTEGINRKRSQEKGYKCKTLAELSSIWTRF